jgi:hypothetical protein
VPINLYLPAETAAKHEAKTPEARSLENWREPPGMLGVYVRRVKKQAGHLALNSHPNTK